MLGVSGRIRTVCVGGVRGVSSGGGTVLTGIYKSRVSGPVRAVGVNLQGDDQADRRVHGGPEKAVYAFPAEHYPGWHEAYPNVGFDDGAFGENLTTEGLLEDTVHIGDRFRVGTAELTVTQPRMPCFKLAIRLGEKTALRHMMETGQTGFYFTISVEGELQAGDELELVGRPEGAVPVASLTQTIAGGSPDPALARTVLEAPGVPEGWRSMLRSKLGDAGAAG